MFEAVGFEDEGAFAAGGETKADLAVGGFGGGTLDETVLFEALEALVDGGVIEVDEAAGVLVDLFDNSVTVEGATAQREQNAVAGGF